MSHRPSASFRLIVSLVWVSQILLSFQLASAAPGVFTSEATLRRVTSTNEKVSGASATPAGAAPGTGPAAVWVVVNVTGPDTVAAGAAVTVTATVTNVSGETARGVRLEVRNAAAARLVGRAAYPLAELAPGAQTTVAVTGDVLARPGARLQTQLVATGGNLTDDAVGAFTPLVRQDVADTWEPGPGAGLWRTPSGFLEIELPADRDAAIKRISQRGLYEAVQRVPGTLHWFEVTAEDEAGLAIHNFTTPVTLRWRYAEALADALPLVPPVFAWWDETAGHWQILPTVADTTRGVIETQVDHFSQFGILPGAQQAPPDPFNGLDSDLFTGALNYRFSLPLATRPAGFAPSLALNYSSRRRDSQDGYGSAGSLVGFGWRLDGLDAIDAVDGGYALALGGATYTLKRTAAWVWYAEEAPGLQISRASSAEDADWHVRTPDGTHRIFTKVQTYWDCDTTPEPDAPRERVKTFLLTSITAPADDGTYSYSINFTYSSDPNITYTRTYNFYCGGSQSKSYVFQALPTQATYNGVNGHNLVVDFSYNTRTDLPAACQTADCTGTDNNQLWYYYTRRLQDVTLKVDAQIMRRYHLTASIAAPDSDRRHDRLLLDNVQRFGKSDALAQPPISFTYRNAPGCHQGANCRLETLNNGQGGLATFTYVAQGGAPANTHRLDTLALRDQVTGSEIQRAFWYNQWDTPAGGYDFVIVTHKGDLTTTADDLLDKHWYYISPNNSKGRWGQEWQASRSDVNGKALDLTQWTLVEPPLPSGSPYQNVRYVVDTVRSYLYDANGANPQQAARQSYAYTLDHQDSLQAGNVTHLREYDAGDNLVRTTERWYHPCVNCNGSRYIADRLAEEQVWQGDVNGTCQAHTRYYYDYQASHLSPPQKGLLTRVEAAQSTCGTGFVIQTQNTYDGAWHNLTRTQDGLGRGVSYTYDTEFRAFIVTATNDLSQVTTTAYPAGDVAQRALGWPSQVTDANSQTTTYTYDPLGRPLTVDRPLGAAIDEAWVYSDYAGPTSPQRLLHKVRDDVTTPPNLESGYLATWTFYDGLGRTIETQGEAEQISNVIVTGAGYDWHGVVSQTVPYVVAAAGGVYQALDWNQPQRRYEYDLLGRTTVVTNTDSSVVHTAYQYLKTVVLDELGHQTIQENDALGRLVSSQQYSGTFASPSWNAAPYATATYGYNVRDQLTSVVGADNATTTLTYDLLGRKTAMTDPDMGLWAYTYDAADNLLTQTDARSTVLWFGYDALNRLTEKRLTHSSGQLLAQHYYDEAGYGASKGRRTRSVAYVNGVANNTTSANYDIRGRVTSTTLNLDGINYTTGYSYDAADRAASMTYPGDEVVNYSYNPRGLLKTVIGASVYVSDTFYNPLAQVTGRFLGASGVVRQAYSYTAAENFRLATLQSGTSPNYTNRQSLSYSYDDGGNVLTISDAAAYGGNQTQTFTYDPLDRLSTAQASGGSNGLYNESYVDSANGNLTSKTGVGSYAYGAQAADCPEGVLSKPHAVVTAGSYTYCYDQNGNMRRRKLGANTYILTYDAENRLTGMSGGVTSSYVYDGDGNRVKETVAGVTRIFIGNTYEVAAGVVKKYYYAGATRVAENSGGTLYYLLTDHLGSTAVTTDSAGNRVTELRYYPYGDSRYNPGSQITTYRFTGQRWDSGTALYWYNSRWYDPLIGRFLAPDSIIPSPGNPQALNRYSYVGNRPLILVDPSGHAECRTKEECEDLGTTPLGRGGQSPHTTGRSTGIPSEASPAPDPILTTYYTPIYDPQLGENGNPVGDPNLWADKSSGSAYANARLQGSFVLNGQLWKYNLTTGMFYALTTDLNAGVPVVLGRLVPPIHVGRTTEGKDVYKVTGAVAAPCPWNVRCDTQSTTYAPVYKQSKDPRQVLYVVTEDLVLIVRPLDSGYGLAPNQIDLYVGYGRTKPEWTYGSTANPRVWIVR